MQIVAERNSTTLFPIPIDTLAPFSTDLPTRDTEREGNGEGVVNDLSVRE